MNEYNTNIVKLTCSCPDWIETRKVYPTKDPRRLCKHIINKLNINNLPYQISKFKESIEFYKKKEWGFKRDFDEIIEIGNFTLLGNTDWIDVFDNLGTKYGVRRNTFSDNIYWVNDLKPIKYEVIEKYLNENAQKLPLALHYAEHGNIIEFIKKIFPNKKNYHITIDSSIYSPTSEGVYYDIWESVYTPTEDQNRLDELLKKYDKETAYYKLNEENNTYSENNQEYRYLKVTNNNITLEMYDGKKYTLERDYQKAQYYAASFDRIGKEWKEKQEKQWQEELKEKRKIAKEKGYLLVYDYQGSLYDNQYAPNDSEKLSLDKYEKIKNSIFGRYDTVQNLIKEYSLDITTAEFNKALKSLNFTTKQLSLNQNNWIIKDDGLKYGINVIKDSIYMHASVPDWYKTYIFDNEQMKLTKLETNNNIKMTYALFEKNKFNELYQLVKQEIEKIEFDKKENLIKPKLPNKKQLEREKWLRHVNCPKCGEKTNIHKKDKRQLSNGEVQRFYCNECNSMFQIDIDKLEEMIQKYEENKDKFKLTIIQKELEK